MNAVTIGKFDGFHLGHQILLNDISEVAKDRGLNAICIKLVSKDAGILSEEEDESFIKDYAGIDEIEKISFTPELAKMSAEDFVRDVLIKKYSVKYIAVGSDFRFGHNRSGDTDTLKELGKELGFETRVFDKLVIDGEVVSSSLIRRALANGDMVTASKMLGRPYSITGKVDGGKKLGRTLGYPTINLKTGDEKLLPVYGVYASRCLIYDERDAVKEYRSITNIGVRPSIDDGDAATIETFIYDFDEDIYGSKVSVILDEYIRPEKKFSGLDELTQQISRDIQVAANR